MGKDSQSDRIGDGGSDSVGVGYFPCALYRVCQQTSPRANRTERPSPEDDLLKDQLGDAPDIISRDASEVDPTHGCSVSTEENGTG